MFLHGLFEIMTGKDGDGQLAKHDQLHKHSKQISTPVSKLHLTRFKI